MTLTERLKELEALLKMKQDDEIKACQEIDRLVNRVKHLTEALGEIEKQNCHPNTPTEKCIKIARKALLEEE